jgi:hypothetical protein
VDNAIKQGKKLDDLVTGDSTRITLPDSVRNWTGKSLPGQVKDTYEEIMQKKPHGDVAH